MQMRAERAPAAAAHVKVAVTAQNMPNGGGTGSSLQTNKQAHTNKQTHNRHIRSRARSDMWSACGGEA